MFPLIWTLTAFYRFFYYLSHEPRSSLIYCVDLRLSFCLYLIGHLSSLLLGKDIMNSFFYIVDFLFPWNSFFLCPIFSNILSISTDSHYSLYSIKQNPNLTFSLFFSLLIFFIIRIAPLGMTIPAAHSSLLWCSTLSDLQPWVFINSCDSLPGHGPSFFLLLSFIWLPCSSTLPLS